MFCNSMTVLPDGRVMINGGTIAYDPFHGIQKSSLFDPATNYLYGNTKHGAWPLVSDRNLAQRRPGHDFLRAG